MTDRRNDENTIDDENKTKHNKKKHKKKSNKKKLATISTVIAVAIELFDGNGDAQKRKCN